MPCFVLPLAHDDVDTDGAHIFDAPASAIENSRASRFECRCTVDARTSSRLYLDDAFCFVLLVPFAE